MLFYTLYSSPVSDLKIFANSKGICAIKFIPKTKLFTEKNKHPFLKAAEKYLDVFFSKKNPNFALPLDLVGTSFQKKVWEALKQIPFGETRTYKQIAIAIGNPKATRAVGMAIHCNPIPIIIPCHRVIGTNGKLTGYANGLELKQKLLNFEHC